MTLEPWKENSILVRFEHILEANEDSEYSKPATFNIRDVFRNFDISEIKETTLAANQWKDEATRMKFRTDDEFKIDGLDISMKEFDEFLDKIKVLQKDASNFVSTESDEETVPRYIRNRSRGVNIGMDTWNIVLQPMEIRTFVISLEWKP